VAADFQARAGVKFLEVPYKGAAPTMSDVASGQVDLTFIPLAGAMLGMIQKKLLKPLALAGERRHPALADVPTFSESAALKGFEHTVWAGLLAPPGTPSTVVARLTAAANEWIASSENLERITANASRRLDPMNVEQNSAFLRREQDKYARLARALKIEPQ
jgi:tripartite-type tricarboxylate transporter receptor subunit TctC